MLHSIEEKREITKAVNEWKHKFSEGAAEIKGLGGNVFWHRHLRIWGFFSSGARYWNTFGTIPGDFRKNMRVELNPPVGGINRRAQGLLATDADGRRWLLHKGRMSIPSLGISFDDFLKVTQLVSSTVILSDGSEEKCFRVLCIDDQAKALQRDLAKYVAECERVRLYYKAGPASAEVDGVVQLLEEGLPESTGKYTVPPQDEKLVDKVHAEIWKHFAQFLTQLGVVPSNKRVGRYGPDLYTTQGINVLFEIKTNSSMSDLQKAVGQLILYEKILGKKYKKVLVFPERLQPDLMSIILELGLGFITYRRTRGAVTFNDKEVREALQ